MTLVFFCIVLTFKRPGTIHERRGAQYKEVVVSTSSVYFHFIFLFQEDFKEKITIILLAHRKKADIFFPLNITAKNPSSN